MASMPGSIYMLVGLMLMGVSYILDLRRETSNLVVFIGIGALMVIIGVVKLFLKKAREPSPKVDEKPVYCGFCGAALNPFDKFCKKCGNRLK